MRLLKSLLKDKRTILILLTVSFLLLAVSAVIFWRKSTYDPEKYSSKISEANSAYEKKEYALALDTYLLASQLAPREYAAHEGTVAILSEKGRFDDAQKVIDEVGKNLTNVERAKLLVILGDRQFEREQYSDAYSSYKEAFSLNGSPEIAELAADTSLKSGNMKDFSKYLGKLDSSSPIRKIWDQYKDLLRTESDLYEVVKGCRVFLNEGYYELSLQLLEDRKNDISEYWEGRYFLGRSYYAANDLAKAKSEFESAVTLGADDADLYWYLGRVNYEQKEDLTSFKYYDRAVQFAEDDEVEPIVREYTDILLEKKQYSKAEQLLEMFSDKEFGQFGLIKLYLAQGDMSKVGDLIEKFNPSEEYEVEYTLLALDYYFGRDNTDKASTHLTKLESIENQGSAISYYQALSALEQQDTDKAKGLLERAIDQDLKGDITQKASKKLAELR